MAHSMSNSIGWSIWSTLVMLCKTTFIVFALFFVSAHTQAFYPPRGYVPVALFGGSFKTKDNTKSLLAFHRDGISPLLDQSIGINGSVFAIAEYKDSKDAKNHFIYIGGSFTEVNGVSGFKNIARFNIYENKWDSMNGGLICRFDLPQEDGVVRSIVVNERNGDVYVGGNFHEATGKDGENILVERIAKYNFVGNFWESLGSGVQGNSENHQIVTMALLPNFRSGNLDLYVAGKFTHSDEVILNNIAMWDGKKWNSLDDGLNGSVHSISALEGGSLIACGNFENENSKIRNIAMWNAALNDWIPIGNGTLSTCTDVTNYQNYIFAITDDEASIKVLRLDAKEWSKLGNSTTWTSTYRLKIHKHYLYALHLPSNESPPSCSRLDLTYLDTPSIFGTNPNWEPFGTHLIDYKEPIESVFIHVIEFVLLIDPFLSFSKQMFIMINCGTTILGIIIGCIVTSIIYFLYRKKWKRKAIYTDLNEAHDDFEYREEF